MRDRILLSLLFAVVLVIPFSPSAYGQSRPYRGSIPWSFLLCKFSDSPTPPHDLNYYQQMTIQTGTNGLADYVHSVSNGAADLGGSSVHGWYTEPHTTAYEQGLSSRYQRLQDCLDTAKADLPILTCRPQVNAFTSSLHPASISSASRTAARWEAIASRSPRSRTNSAMESTSNIPSRTIPTTTTPAGRNPESTTTPGT